VQYSTNKADIKRPTKKNKLDFIFNISLRVYEIFS